MTLKSTAFRLGPAAGVILAAACDRPGTPLGPVPSREISLVQQAVQAPDVEVLARTIPGFGGFYLDDKGVPTVYLTDMGQRGAAEAALGAYAGARGFRPADIRVLQGDYTYKELDRWFTRVSPEVLAVTGTVFTDLDEATNRVLVGVENAQAAVAVKGVAARLGLPRKAMVVNEVEPIHFMATLRDRVRPVVGGLQINFSNFLCTLGFNAVDGTENSFVTASHCTTVQGGVDNAAQYWQPLSSVAESFIGTEVEDPAYFTGGVCPDSRRCRYSDAARASYPSGVTFTPGGIARTTRAKGSITIDGSFTVTAESGTNPLVGERVHKVGRTTGWTRGRVSNTCVTVNVFGSDITQLCQAIVDAGVGAGDSGSPVFSGSTNVTLYGVLWGGNFSGTSFVYSPLNNIQQELGALATCSTGC
jgi:hypothetical protein